MLEAIKDLVAVLALLVWVSCMIVASLVVSVWQEIFPHRLNGTKAIVAEVAANEVEIADIVTEFVAMTHDPEIYLSDSYLHPLAHDFCDQIKISINRAQIENTFITCGIGMRGLFDDQDTVGTVDGNFEGPGDIRVQVLLSQDPRVVFDVHVLSKLNMLANPI